MSRASNQLHSHREARECNLAKDESWFEKAADLMVRNGWSLKQAITELRLQFSGDDIARFTVHKGLQAALAAARLRYATEVAASPARTKAALIGELQILAWKLRDDGEYDKAAELLFKIAKIEGWVGAESNVNVFTGLSHEELDSELKRLEKGKSPSVLSKQPEPN